MSTLLRVLGPLEVWHDGVILPIRSHRQRALLTRLVIDSGHVASVNQLIECAWDEDTLPTDPSSALQNQIFRLRNFLGPLRDLLRTKVPGYVFDIDPECIDANQFERLIREAHDLQSSAPRKSLHLLENALDLWQGPAFVEFSDGFARARAASLEQEKASALERRIDLLLTVGETSAAIAAAESLNAEEPLRENPYSQRMRGLVLEGRTNEALNVFQELRNRLASDLGTEPSHEARDLHIKILRQEVETPLAFAKNSDAAIAPLPLPPKTESEFIGREVEIESIIQYVHKHRITSIVGPGGVGKTRLAVEAAERISEFNLVCWVDLSEIRDESLVTSTILNSLGVIDPPRTPSVQALLSVLRGQQLTLLLDNCEHMLNGVAEVIGQVSSSCPTVHVITTSREPLRVVGEQVLLLQPLTLAANGTAMTMFLSRLQAAGLILVEGNKNELDLAAQIVERLDGLPLALEIAAANAVELGLPAVLEDTENWRLDGGIRSAAVRHQDLNQLLAWSYELLDEQEKILFSRLAVFPGKFSMRQIEQVCASEPLCLESVKALLASLVRKSLVSRAVTSNVSDRAFSLLSTVRHFALGILAVSQEKMSIEERALIYTLEWATNLDVSLSSGEEIEITQFAESLNDLRSAYAWANEHDPERAIALIQATAILAFHRLEYEVLGWAEHEVQTRRFAKLPTRLLFAATSSAIRKGSLELAREYAAEGLSSASSASEEAVAILGMTHFLLIKGEPRQAMEQSAIAWQAYGTSGDVISAMAHAGTVAIAASYLAEHAVADAWVSRCHELASKFPGSLTLRAYAAYFAGETQIDRNPDQALSELSLAFEISSRIGDRFIAGISLTSAVTLRARLHKTEASFDAYIHAMDSLFSAGDTTALWLTVRNIIPLLVQERPADSYALYVAMTNSTSAPPVYGQEEDTLEEAACAALNGIDPRTAMEITAYWRGVQDVEVFNFAIAVARDVARDLGSASGDQR
ncbi:BTAD domain-containing putative transcriptional regulator [Streptomyces sp. 3211]|uniref:BTAD domain-containing putative transcriptional regulator n=1 Tax=Streptomyces sp. 3211 TaxID=1964449 RepID=UPI001331B42A|nr:BTAD domain-containing putative transcriptional regulator [Streptomyces sp. 3211]